MKNVKREKILRTFSSAVFVCVCVCGLSPLAFAGIRFALCSSHGGFSDSRNNGK